VSRTGSVSSVGCKLCEENRYDYTEPHSHSPEHLKLHLAQNANQNLISGYGIGYVAVNGQRYERNLIVTPNQIVDEWEVQVELNEAALEPIERLVPQIILFGTGKTLRFPAAAVLKRLITLKIGYEFMDTQAACRTYNILLEEGRNVAVALRVV
jgi:uncharacterized protein